MRCVNHGKFRIPVNRGADGTFWFYSCCSHAFSIHHELFSHSLPQVLSDTKLCHPHLTKGIKGHKSPAPCRDQGGVHKGGGASSTGEGLGGIATTTSFPLAGGPRHRGGHACLPCSTVAHTNVPDSRGWNATESHPRLASPPSCGILLVHGLWEEWSPWSLCSATCGRGSRTRTRSCVAPQQGGKACDGSDHQSKLCNIAVCPG